MSTNEREYKDREEVVENFKGLSEAMQKDSVTLKEVSEMLENEEISVPDLDYHLPDLLETEKHLDQRL